MISLKQLRYALAVEKHLHFKKAAEECSVSQSALSSALSELEKQLGILVFERDNKKVLITPIGQAVLDKARTIKLEVDDLYQLARSHNEPLSYPMTMGIIPTIGPYLLPKVLPNLRKKHPGFQLRIVEDQSHVLVDKVRNGDIDTAILALPFSHEGLLAFEFWEEDFYWITHRDDALAQHDNINSDEINYSQLMLLKDGHCLKEHALSACKLQPSQTNQIFGSSSLNTLIQMVAGRMGTTIVPEMALDQLVSTSSELHAAHLNETSPHRRIAFIVRPNYAGVANIEKLMKMFSEDLTAFLRA
ncbi:MAG: LysR family hydrogen peroxide-inducible transcriptional activator [Oleiphilaceae bacterium]|jgi:LysR family hydrogen peroxide-inducible transcriptional activator